MYRDFYDDFLQSDDTLRIYSSRDLIFSSKKDRLAPLLDYLDNNPRPAADVVIFDKIMGNGAALLAVKAHCKEVFSPLGSGLAMQTLDKYRIAHHITTTVPFIQRPDMVDMCPMERLSIGKEPEEFYRAMKSMISKSPAAPSSC